MTTTTKIITLLLTSALLISGCGKREDSKPAPSTPLETVECVMESIRDLDMETLNSYTDNYVQTYHNWIGVPMEHEYRTFNELLQPHSKNGSRYQSAYKLDQKMMENLTWEITDVRENTDSAEIDMSITNIDMSQVIETYTAQILDDMLQSPGITQFAKSQSNLGSARDSLISIIDELGDNDICTTSVTALAYQENGQWKIHLTPELINAFSGNMYDDTDSAGIAELEELLDAKINEWAEDFEEKAEHWADNFEKKWTNE